MDANLTTSSNNCQISMINKPTKKVIQQAAELLHEGKLVAFPTETVYGLGAAATNPAAVKQIFSVKGRPRNHPVIVHLADVKQLEQWARVIPPFAWRLAQQFWPGPLTLLLPKAAGVSDAITGQQDTVGLRIPAHPIAQALLKAFGEGIAAPSANRFGQISPTLAEHVQQELGSRVDLILDGGPCSCGIESTILDCSGEQPRILRPGIITASQLSAVVGTLAINITPDAPRVSGALASHYAPQTPLQIVAAPFVAAPPDAIVLAMHPPAHLSPSLQWLQMPTDPLAYAHDLYAALRFADAQGCSLILVEEIPAGEEWDAIRDRLQKAAAEKPENS